VIVVDNSSTDNTEDVLNSFDDKRLTIIKVNNNGIIAHSRNKGIENAKGDWIAFLDSDDVWQPEKLEVIKNTIVNNPEAILVCHDEWHIVNNEKKKILKNGPGGNDLYERLIFKGNCLSTSATCVNSKIAKKLGGFSERVDFITVEDYEYWLRFSKEGECYFINETLGEWHTHETNYSNNAKIHANAIISVHEYYLDLWLKDHPFNYIKVRYTRGLVFSGAARILQKGCRFSEASKYAIKSICINPIQLKVWIVLLFSLLKFNR
jgi:glycosyltransferase involved in cell wall biosynthesis